MGPDKDDKEPIDDVEQYDVDQDLEQQQEKEVPKDIRGAIRHAVEQHTDDDKSDEPDLAKDKGNKKSAKSSDNTELDGDVDPKDDKSKVSKKDTKDKSEQVSSSESKEEKKLAPPPGWTKEGKAIWEKLPPEAQTSVLKREKEFSDGVAGYAQKARAYDELDQVIAPRRQQITQFGVTPAQTIDRLFQWMEALSNPNAGVKSNAFKALASSFGVDVAQLISNAENSQTTDDAGRPLNQSHPQIDQLSQYVSAEIGTLKQQLATQREETAGKVITNWASDKTHFPQVRDIMHHLLATGIVPLKNGEVDLDTAYAQAIKLHPEVSAEIEREASEKAAKDAAEKSKKEAQLSAARAAKAKQAGSGLKPAAPSLTTSKPGGKPNGIGTKKPSVRDSLMMSISEARDN